MTDSRDLAKVSIVVPVYNVEDYLDKCLNSLVKQTLKDIEIILVDDGSTDRSGDICSKWEKKDHRITYIRNKHEGLGPTRNLGIKVAKGKYIMFVDSDDWIENDAAELMYNTAERLSADIVIGDFNYVVKDLQNNIKVNVSKLRIDGEVPIDPSSDIKLIDKARLFLIGKMFNREFLINSGVEQPVYAFEDVAIVPFLVVKAKIICRVPKPLYNYYRCRTNSIVNSVERYGDLKKALMEMKRSFVREGIYEKYYEVLKKISYSQVRFIYMKLLGNNEEISTDNKWIIEELYEFMDREYPDWINIDKYSIGITSNNSIIKGAVNKLVFNSKTIYEVEDNYNELLDKDILILDSADNLEVLEKNCYRGKVLLINFINEEYKSKDISNYIYDLCESSKLNLKVIDFKLDKVACEENIEWDLSDEILRNL